MDTVFHFSRSGNIFMTSGYQNFLRFYETLLAIFFLLGIWKPGIITEKLPQEFKDRVVNFVKKGGESIVDLRNLR